jgi:hypothetical protein
MKIYINNFNIDILTLIMKTLSQHFISSESYMQIYSEDGIYKIDNSSIKKQIIIDKEIQIFKEYYEEFTLIADPSLCSLQKVNKIPCEHLVSNVKRCFFTPNKKSPLKLVIEGTTLEETVCNKLFNIYNMEPYDIYLEVDEDINLNDELVKREIIVFLSLLN